MIIKRRGLKVGFNLTDMFRKEHGCMGRCLTGFLHRLSLRIGVSLMVCVADLNWGF